MGKGGTSYHERQLTPEERALIAQQQRYLASIQPSIDTLVSRGTSLLDDVINPDWKSIYSQEVKDVDQIQKEQYGLTQGELPQAYTDAKMNYFNRLYENTMGKGMAAMAKNGVIDSSRFNTTTNDFQKNLTSQMSQDFTNDMNMQKNLLDQRYQFAKAPMEIAQAANKASFGNPAQYLALAQGQNQANNEAIQATGQLNNGRGYVTQIGSGCFGGLLSGVGCYLGSLACFPSSVKVATERGNIPINELEEGDIVISKDGIQKVLEVLNCGEKELIALYTENHGVITTPSQTVVTRSVIHRIEELRPGIEVLTDTGFECIVDIDETGETDTVYELIVTGSNLFYANGICVEGMTEEELNAIHSV